jgi:hypothetical protein
MNQMFDNVLCGNCLKPGLTVQILQGMQRGFSSRIKLMCPNCPEGQEIYTSPRVKSEDARYLQPFDINRRLTLVSHELGAGHSSLRKISNVMGMPNMHLKTYQMHDKKMSGQ